MWPPEARTAQEQAEGVEELPIDDATRAAFERYRAGDQSAGPLLQQSLQAANQQTAAVVRDSLTRGQPNTAPATARPGEKVGVLQTPAFLNAQLNVAETALNTEDAFQKLAIEEAGVLAAAREAGLGDLFTPDYFKGRYGDMQNGTTGPFPADPAAIQARLNAAQANDPDYINYINRVGGVTAAAEINRRQNILADAKQKIAGAGAQKERNRASDDLARQLSEMDEDFQLDSEAILAKGGADGEAVQRALDRLYRETTVKKERLENALWRAMADADPARAVAYFAAREQPQGENAITGRAPGPISTAPPTSKGPPTEGINLAAAYGTRDRFGNLTYPGRENGIFANAPAFTPPGTTPPPAPAPAQPEKPTTPPPPGKDYFFENGRWVLKDIAEYQPETPAFAEGGYEVGAGSGGDYGSYPDAAAPPTPAAPPSSLTTPPPSEGAVAPPAVGASGGATGELPPTDVNAQQLADSAEYRAIQDEIGQTRQQAQVEAAAYNAQAQRIHEAMNDARRAHEIRKTEVGLRSSSAGADIAARYAQIETQIRAAAGQNPFVMRQIEAYVARLNEPGIDPAAYLDQLRGRAGGGASPPASAPPTMTVAPV